MKGNTNAIIGGSSGGGDTVSIANYYINCASSTFVSAMRRYGKHKYDKFRGSPQNYIAMLDIKDELILSPTNMYMKCSFLNTADTWEIFTKFTTGSDADTRNVVFGQMSDNYNTPQLEIGSNNKFNFCISTNGSSWTYDQDSTMSASINTTYYVKMEFTGTAYVFTIYDENKNVLETITQESSSKVVANGIMIVGNDGVEGSAYWRGSIDLGEWYIKVNGEYYWLPEKQVSLNIIGIKYSF